MLANNDLGEEIRATPAVIGGVLYLRSTSGVSAYGQK